VFLLEIFDCRRKERLFISKKGGDLEIRVEDLEGKVLYVGWFQMKQPWMRTYREIEAWFTVLKSKLERQEE